MSSIPELHPPPGAVELREDVPLKPSGAGSARGCGDGPRLIPFAFAVLSAAISVALLTQIYYGDYEVVPHGSVSSSAAPCSAAGAGALRAGGSAADAVAAAALCLALLAPHRTSLDASGALIYWRYRSSRTELPTIVEWGGPEATGADAARTPRLLTALAALHVRFGVLPWAEALRPTIALAREGFPVSDALAAAAGARGVAGFAAHTPRLEPALADYLETFQHNTSSELCAAWTCAGAARWRSAEGAAAGDWRVWGAGAGGARAVAALQDAFAAATLNVTGDGAVQSAVRSLQRQAAQEGARWPAGVASGLAAVDARDGYAALVTGLSAPFGSGAGQPSADPWTRDEPSAPLDLAPAIIVDQHVCGTRYVVGAESGAALAQGAAALRGAGAGGAVRAAERARVLVRAGGGAVPEPGAPPEPLPALNFVQQSGDALLSHADSRGGGVASRF